METKADAPAGSAKARVSRNSAAARLLTIDCLWY